MSERQRQTIIYIHESGFLGALNEINPVHASMHKKNPHITTTSVATATMNSSVSHGNNFIRSYFD